MVKRARTESSFADGPYSQLSCPDKMERPSMSRLKEGANDANTECG